MNKPPPVIRPEALRRFPERPESEFEWEDLLLRLELMPRALKVELEMATGGDVAAILAEVNDREMAVQELLEEVALDAHPGSTASRVFPDSPESPADVPEPKQSSPHEPTPYRPAANPSAGSLVDAGVDRFVRLRGRNFAMLQRRGIDVWDWRIRVPHDGDATVFQLLSLLARDDVEILSRLRTARTSMSGAC